MAEISIGDAVGAGFGLIRRRPTSVLLWGLVQTAMLSLTFALMMPMYETMFAQMAQAGRGAVLAPRDAATMMQFQGLSYLLNFMSLFVNAVLYCAVFRAIIHPDQSRFWSLRVGVTELMLFVLMIGFFIVFFIALFVIMIPSAVIIGVLGATHAVGAAIAVGVLIGGACVCGWIYVAIRFSIMGPMMVDDGKVHIFDAWTATNGKVGSLFVIGLCIVVILIVLEFVVLALMMGLGFGVLGAVAGGVQAIPALLKQNPAAILSSLGPVLLILGLMAIPLYGALYAVMCAPWARAYLDVRGNPADAF